MAKQTIKHQWYDQRKWAAVIIVVSLAACYGLASLAINSGSLLQYFIAIGLLILAVNRLAHIAIVSTRRRAL